jgi:succinate dehydrogenase hydrophobic anchor subunit
MLTNHTFEWLFLRFTAIWSLFSLFFFFYLFVVQVQNAVFDVFNCMSLFQLFYGSLTNLNVSLQFFLFLSLIFLAFHMFFGLITILQDYVHNEKTKFFGEFIILLIIFETLKYFYIFLFF